jgi:hypothetical protein
LSSKPSSSIIHHEDGGSVYSSIRNDGTIIHWCDKCGAIWISKEQPEAKVAPTKRLEINAFIAELRSKRMK